MVLDDPGESFDMIRMDNFAKAMQAVPGRHNYFNASKRLC